MDIIIFPLRVMNFSCLKQREYFYIHKKHIEYPLLNNKQNIEMT